MRNNFLEMHKSSPDILSSIANHLMINCSFLDNFGLLYGRMGVILFFYHYSRYSQDLIYEEFADLLLDDFFEDIHDQLPVDFVNGYLGIGWGIEYLAHQNFIAKENINVVLKDIDRKVMERNVKRVTDLSLNQGLEGIFHYVLFRLYGNKDAREIFDKMYLMDLLDTVNVAQVKYGKPNTLFILMEMYKKWFYDKVWEYDYNAFWSKFCRKNKFQYKEICDWKLGIADGYAGIGFNEMGL